MARLSSTTTSALASSLAPLAVRRFSTTPLRLNAPAVKPSVQNIAALRRARPVPMSLAREALSASNNDVSRALAWLETHTSHSDAKAAKVSGRSTNEGTIAVSLLSGKRVSMVHLGCETDFVARNEVFLSTARGVAGTAAFLDVPTDAGEPVAPVLGQDPILDFKPAALLSAPLIALPGKEAIGGSSSGSSIKEGGETSGPISTSSEPQTIQQTLLSALGSTGENLKLLRAVSFAAPFPSSADVRYVPGCYAHGGTTASEGKVAGVVVLTCRSAEGEKPIASLIHGPNGSALEEDLSKLARTLARQVVGFPTKVVKRASDGKDKELDGGEVLLEQQAMMMGEDRSVGEVIQEWGKERGVVVDVAGMRRWAVGDLLPVDEGAEAS